MPECESGSCSDALQFIANLGQTSQVRRETVGGKQFLVSPVVAICEGVLNGELVKAEEISAHVGAWGGRPFTVGHPVNANGQRISASTTPAILAHWSIGEFYPLSTSAYDGGKLRGEGWVEIERAKAKGGDALEVLQRLESGTPLEVSTAYFRDREAATGNFNGQAYDGVAHNLRPDHLAALLHAQGACSWADGCGTPRVNQEEEHMAEEDKDSQKQAADDLSFAKRFVTAMKQALGINSMGVNMREKILKDGRLGLPEEQLTALPDEVVDALGASLEAAPVGTATQGNELLQANDEDPDGEESEPLDIQAMVDVALMVGYIYSVSGAHHSAKFPSGPVAKLGRNFLCNPQIRKFRKLRFEHHHKLFYRTVPLFRHIYYGLIRLGLAVTVQKYDHIRVLLYLAAHPQFGQRRAPTLSFPAQVRK